MDNYKPFTPKYSFFEKLERLKSISQTVIGASKIVLRSRKLKLSHSAFGASVEITDRCNAGCHHCYVYDPDWDQNQRMRGYLQLPVAEHRNREKQVHETLDRLSSKGIVHVTLVGGEPLLAPKIIHYASDKFPIVWVVTNGAAKFPSNLARSIVLFVSIDGLPDVHNKMRDPLGFFQKNSYEKLEGMSAAIVRNINESERGAFVHTTLTKNTFSSLPEIIDWLVRDVKKLRGIVVSGAAMQSIDDPNALSIDDRQQIKRMISEATSKYSSKLFPFNSSTVNSFLFDPENIIKHPNQCTVARRVDSLGFDGQIVGKCVLRDSASCETCICNITGLMRAASAKDPETIKGLYGSCFG
jgi:sulfatase maturation enzyme AslB (radical SAM superfamily)